MTKEEMLQKYELVTPKDSTSVTCMQNTCETVSPNIQVAYSLCHVVECILWCEGEDKMLQYTPETVPEL